MTKFHEIAVVSDLFEAGRRDDGMPFIAERYFVQITEKDGSRFRHVKSFPGTVRSYNEEGEPYFPDLREVAKRDATYLMERIKVDGTINKQYWYEIRPVYGSTIYEVEMSVKTDFERSL